MSEAYVKKLQTLSSELSDHRAELCNRKEEVTEVSMQGFSAVVDPKIKELQDVAQLAVQLTGGSKRKR
jgi:hypothetical protein